MGGEGGEGGTMPGGRRWEHDATWIQVKFVMSGYSYQPDQQETSVWSVTRQTKRTAVKLCIAPFSVGSAGIRSTHTSTG